MDLNLQWCWNLLAEGAILLWNCVRIEGLFQTITALFSKILQSFKGNAQSQATLSVRNIRLGITNIGRLYVKKAEPMS